MGRVREMATTTPLGVVMTPTAQPLSSPALLNSALRRSALKQRRNSMTPEDRTRLLRQEDKVIAAALHLHVIHDVPLSELEARLTEEGVEPDMKQRALEAIKAKLARSRPRVGSKLLSAQRIPKLHQSPMLPQNLARAANNVLKVGPKLVQR